MIDNKAEDGPQLVASSPVALLSLLLTIQCNVDNVISNFNFKVMYCAEYSVMVVITVFSRNFKELCSHMS